VNNLCRANLILAILAALPPLAHVLELPNKFTLDGGLWLAVQQHLYRGWGPFLGGPAEISALITTVALLVLRRKTPQTRLLSAMAAAAYTAMLITFFLFNDPVNKAITNWTPATLPSNWADYRLRWEVGHAIAALFSVAALAALVRARMIERGDSSQTE